STLEMACLLPAAVLVGAFPPVPASHRLSALAAMGTALAIAVLVFGGIIEGVDRYLEETKYEAYRVEATFDTHYAHQTIVSRDSLVVLLTDNTVEASYPEPETAENLLLPPLLYKPDAKEVLLIGRGELGVAQLAGTIPDLTLTTLDPRRKLSRHLDELIPCLPAGRGTATDGSMERINDDPVAFFGRGHVGERYDVVIVNPGEFDSYRNSRLLTGRFLQAVRSSLTPGGILCLPRSYDTDRYVTGDVQQVLGTIRNVLAEGFAHVAIWPGTMTLFLASDRALFDISYDTLVSRIQRLPFEPQYIQDYYLYDRLDQLRRDRLHQAITHTGARNNLRRPILAQYQALYRARTDKFDRQVLSLVFGSRIWLVVLPFGLMAFCVIAAVGGSARRRFGLFLYLVAGLVSLALELLSFYVYQSSAGSLYAELAVLIGAFMLGLAFGTWYSVRMKGERMEYPALLTLLTACVLFLLTFERVDPRAQLPYHLLFLFVVAA
ncbi:MAG: hypothetical protein AB1744_13420, partial [Candidatus Zixiibacteriota bacterium]